MSRPKKWNTDLWCKVMSGIDFHSLEFFFEAKHRFFIPSRSLDQGLFFENWHQNQPSSWPVFASVLALVFAVRWLVSDSIFLLVYRNPWWKWKKMSRLVPVWLINHIDELCSWLDKVKKILLQTSCWVTHWLTSHILSPVKLLSKYALHTYQ